MRLYVAIIFLTSLFLFVGCSKSPESRADAFLKAAEQAKNPRVKEEREKKAYLKYLEAVNFYALKGKKVPDAVREKLLGLTLKKLNRELDRFVEKAEEANIDQIGLWRQDFDTYLPGLNNPKLIRGYSQFLLSFANPDYMEMDDVVKVLKEVADLGVLAQQAKQKHAAIRSNYADKLMKEVAEAMAEARGAKGKISQKGKENLVFAEYKTLLALKYNPTHASATDALGKLRKILLDTYSGYERFATDLDPEVDKYDIYLCVPKKRETKKGMTMELSLWNLTANPIMVRHENLYLVSDRNDTIQAHRSTKFHKILVDTKTDTSQVVVFRYPKKKKVTGIRNVLYSDGRKISEKFFH